MKTKVKNNPYLCKNAQDYLDKNGFGKGDKKFYRIKNI